MRARRAAFSSGVSASGSRRTPEPSTIRFMKLKSAQTLTASNSACSSQPAA